MASNNRILFHGKGGMTRYRAPEPSEEEKNYKPGIKSITEAAREVEVIREADKRPTSTPWTPPSWS